MKARMLENGRRSVRCAWIHEQVEDIKSSPPLFTIMLAGHHRVLERSELLVGVVKLSGKVEEREPLWSRYW